jgi:hypothetical protein
MSYTSITFSGQTGVEPGLHVNQPVLDGSQVRLDRGEAAGDGIGGHRDGCARVGRALPGEHGVQVAGVPAQRDGQGFEGACATAALRGVAVQLADDRLRDVRAFGEIALTHAEFGQPPVHRLGNGRPVVRHRFPALPRAPP